MILSNICCIVAFLIVICEAQHDDAQYDDVRCKCVCPKEINRTKNVFVKTVEPEDCNCGKVVQGDEKYCLRCRCEYEARNTTLIKVVIIFILVVIGILCFYLLYLFIDSKRKPVELSVAADEIQETLRGRRARSLRNFDEKLAKWKKTVAEQRRNIYGTRTMLS